MIKKITSIGAISALILGASAPGAYASPSHNTSDTGLGTYNDYSRLFERSAGQFFSAGGSWKGQWAWEPKENNESWIRWGDPAEWPPDTYEKFKLSEDGQWVLLDGYGDSTTGGFNPQRVTRETISDVDCVSNKIELPQVEGGKQHYVKWFAQPTPYCLEAWGTITHPGGVVNFYHKQVWFEPSGPWCDNSYYQDQVCMKQYEVWEDDNPDTANYGPGSQPGLHLVHRRDNILAKGLGMTFIHENYLSEPSWMAYGRYYWSY